MDISLLYTCRYTGTKRVESENESDFRRCQYCGGYTAKYLGEDRQVTFDLTVDNEVVPPTKIVVPKQVINEIHDFRCSHCASKITDQSELKGLIELANELHDSAVEGADHGEYEAGSKATFKEAIDEAQEIIDEDRSLQTEADVAKADEDPNLTVGVENDSLEVAFNDLKDAIEVFENEMVIEFIEVAEIVPNDEATDVAIDADITVQFDENIQEGSDFDTGITITDGDEEVAFTTSISTDTLTISPEENLDNDTEYTVSISSNAVARDDNEEIVMEEDFVSIFTTVS